MRSSEPLGYGQGCRGYDTNHDTNQEELTLSCQGPEMTDGGESSERLKATFNPLSVVLGARFARGAQVATSALAARSEFKVGKERLNRVPQVERNPRSPGEPSIAPILLPREG